MNTILKVLGMVALTLTIISEAWAIWIMHQSKDFYKSAFKQYKEMIEEES